MNPLYVQTFRRRRRLFIAIVIVAVVSSMWMSLGAPKMYRSAVTLWADAPGADSQGAGVPSPASREQTTLNQLLALEVFRKRVAHSSPWPPYLKSHTLRGWGPGAIVALLRGGGAGSVDARIDSAVDPMRVTSAVPAGGLNVLQITYEAPTPALARGTLQALVDEYMADRVELPTEMLSSYAQQLQRASAAAVSAREKLDRYRRRHPGSSNSRAVKNLQSAVGAANYQAAEARKALQAAGSSASSAPKPTVEVKDGPTLPAVRRPVTSGYSRR